MFWKSLEKNDSEIIWVFDQIGNEISVRETLPKLNQNEKQAYILLVN